MKRIGYLHEQVYDIENIEKADDKARKHKSVRWGILKHDKNREEENRRKFCNSKNLLRKIQRDTGLRFSNWDGKKSNISRFYNKYIHIVDIVSYSKCFRVNFVYNNKSYYFESRNLFYSLTRYSFPVNFKIRPYVRTKKNRNGCAARLNREIR